MHLRTSRRPVGEVGTLSRSPRSQPARHGTVRAGAYPRRHPAWSNNDQRWSLPRLCLLQPVHCRKCGLPSFGSRRVPRPLGRRSFALPSTFLLHHLHHPFLRFAPTLKRMQSGRPTSTTLLLMLPPRPPLHLAHGPLALCRASAHSEGRRPQRNPTKVRRDLTCLTLCFERSRRSSQPNLARFGPSARTR